MQLHRGQEIRGKPPPPKGSGRNPSGDTPRQPQPLWDLALKTVSGGSSLMVQGLKLHIPNVAGPGSISGQGTRSHRPQLRVCKLQLKIPHAAKTQCSHINK